MAVVDVSSEIEVGCTASEAFLVISDMSRNVEWQSGMKSCVWTSDPPLVVGSTYDQVASMFGRPILTSFSVSEFVPDERIRIVSTSSTFPLDITRSVEDLGGNQCVVRAHVTGDSGKKIPMPAAPLRWFVRRSITKDYVCLKALLEAS